MSSIQSYIEGGTTIIKSYIVFRVTTATISGGVQSIVAGTGINVDDTDPANPVVSATGGGGGSVDSVNGQTGVVVLDAGDVGADPAGSAAAAAAASQPVDSDLTAIANLTPSNGDFLYRESGAWVNKTTAQVKALLGLKTVILQNDQTNQNAVANTAEDLAGMSFSVLAGKKYKFMFNVGYTSAASTTGSRFTINASVALTLYHAYYINTLTGTTQTLLFVNASDSPSASNASSVTTGNTCFSTGIFVPASDCTVKLQFASEVAGSGITARAGSWFSIEEG